MKVPLLCDDPVLRAHVNRVTLAVADAHGVPAVAISAGSVNKRPSVCRAREELVQRLRETVQQTDCWFSTRKPTETGTRGRVVLQRRSHYRILEAGAPTYVTADAPANGECEWRPLSMPRLAELLGLDHSAVVMMLRRARARLRKLAAESDLEATSAHPSD